MSVDDLARALRGVILNTYDNRGRPAEVGRKDGTVAVLDESGNEIKTKIWAHYTDTDTPFQDVIVRRAGVPRVAGVHVRIRPINGTLTAELDRSSTVAEASSDGGTTYPTDDHDHYIGSPNPDYVQGERILPLGVVSSTPPALTVYVFPGFYRWEGTRDLWEGGDSADLTSYVPGTDDGTVHFVIICLDRSNNTLAIVDGADVAGGGDVYFPDGADVELTDIAAISISNAAYLPLGAVLLTYGQTKVYPSNIIDARLWGLEAGLDINGLTAQSSPTPGADYIPIYDAGLTANRKVLLQNLTPGNVAMLFSQTADKTIADTVTETTLLTTGVGSLTLPANLLAAGTVIRLSLAGHVSTTGTPTIDITAKLGGTELASTGAHTLGDTISNVGWRMFLNITCRTAGATGTVVVSGFIRVGDQLPGQVETDPITIDTTGTNVIDVTAEWGTASASNTITCQEAIVEHLAVIGL